MSSLADREFCDSRNNLSDLEDPLAARENLVVVQGHQINGLPQRPNLTISGVGVSAYNILDATVVYIAQTVRTFADLLGVAAVAQGGTGATNVTDARKNLGLHKVAAMGQYADLLGRPSFVSYLSNVGEGTGGAPLIQSIVQTIASVRTLKSDGTLSIIRDPTDDDHLLLTVDSVPVDRVSGVLPPAKGGTGLGQSQLNAAAAGTVLTLNSEKTFSLLSVSGGGHVIYSGDTQLVQRPNLKFEGTAHAYDDPDATATVQPLQPFVASFDADSWQALGESGEFVITYSADDLPFGAGIIYRWTFTMNTGMQFYWLPASTIPAM